MQIGVHAVGREREGITSLPKSAGPRQDVEQRISREHVDSHRRDERLALDAGANVEPTGTLRPSAASRSALGFFEPDDLAFPVEAEDAHLGRLDRRDRLRGDRDVGPRLDVRVDEVAEIHPVQMIARENQVEARVERSEMADRLPDRVCVP